MNKERAIQTVVEDLDSRRRLSSIRDGLKNAGFSSEEIQQIITEAIELRNAGRQEQRTSGREPAIAVFALAAAITLVTYLLTAPGGLYVVPVGLFSYSAYLWYGKPKGRDGQQ